VKSISRLKQTAGFFSARTWTQQKISWKLLHVEVSKAFLGRADALKKKRC